MSILKSVLGLGRPGGIFVYANRDGHALFVVELR